MKVLDLFCGAGGCSKGYSNAGFDVVGVDCRAVRNYPFPLVVTDVFEFLENNDVSEFDLIHASPPCHAYSVATVGNRANGIKYPDLVARVRNYLIQLEKPYVIENVPGSPLKNYVELSGGMFGLKVIRKRWFECNFPVEKPGFVFYPKGLVSGGNYVCVVTGKFESLRDGSEAMGIDWMTKKDLVLAIPPAYTEYIGRQFLFSKGIIDAPEGLFVGVARGGFVGMAAGGCVGSPGL